MKKIKVDSKEWNELLDRTIWLRQKKKSETAYRALVGMLVGDMIKNDYFWAYQNHKLLHEKYEAFLGSCEEK